MAPRRWLMLGDLLALLAFSLVGLLSHEREPTVAAFARTYLPFAVCWLLVASVLGGFQPVADGRPVRGMGILALWLPAGVLGLFLRSMVFDRTLFTAFFVIALIGNGLFLFGWRAVAARFLREAPVERLSPGKNVSVKGAPGL
jgi:hypothetical protein